MNTLISDTASHDALCIDGKIALWCYDLDGNILNTETPVYMFHPDTKKEVEIPGHILDKNPDILGKFCLYDNPENSFASFRDHSFRNGHAWFAQLSHDIQKAIDNGDFGSSFQSFKELFLVKARFFSIITARGHSADNLQKNIEYLSNATLSQEEQDEQADNVRKLWDRRFSYPPFHNQEMLHWFFTEIGSYYPVGNPHIYRGNLHAINISSAERKTLAMKQSIQHTRHMVSHVLWICHNAIPLNIGFSDDSLHNIRAMKAFFEHHAKHEKLISSKDKIRLYHTGHDAPQTIKI